ncbi:MAG: FKBP-type peptidyl-prolyl cis-trans isomerase [Candidatus Methanomethylophilaceae archaeon]|nr:FKBP-type peptidyl-prolyl cis-trans isomerase [Candidatus Methanomethylophilaceae archaeon]
MAGDKTVRKDRDPIMLVCGVIFLVAAVVVIGCFVSDEWFPSGEKTASNGDKVTVEYTGTFYDEYGGTYAVVFDTNVSSIGNDTNIAKSNDFTAKTSYSPLEFTIGKGTMLKAFEESVIGHKVGDKYKIELTAAQGYIGASTEGYLNTSGNVMSTTVTMTKTDFAAAYSDVTLKDNGEVKFVSKYKWDAYASYTDMGNAVLITYVPEAGETYEVYKSGDTVVNYKVKTVSSGKITYDIEIKNPVKVGSTEIQMIKLDLGTKTIYITNIDGSDIIYKEGAERVNQPLFFEIKVLTIE